MAVIHLSSAVIDKQSSIITETEKVLTALGETLKHGEYYEYGSSFVSPFYVCKGDGGSIVCGGFDKKEGVITTAIVFMSPAAAALRQTTCDNGNTTPISVAHYFSDVLYDGEHYNCNIPQNNGKFFKRRGKFCAGVLEHYIDMEGNIYIILSFPKI